MKRKARKGQRTQTVRVEVVAPQNGHTEAIVPAPRGPSVGLSDSVEVALERAQKQMYFRNQLLKLIAKQINPRDIYIYVLGVQCLKCNGSVKPSNSGPGYYCKRCGVRKVEETEENLEPYLSGSGCRFVLSSAGAKFSNPEIIEKQYDGTEGPYIDFEVWVTVETADGRCVRTMGNNATDDDFFAKRWRYICPNCEEPTVLGYKESCAVHGQVKAKRDPYYLSLQEVDIPAVKQKAMTNAWNHAVRDLGFMPNIQHLKEAGVDIKKLRRIDFAKRESDEQVSNEFPAAASKQPPGKATAGGVGLAPPAGGSKSKETPKGTGNATQQAGQATNGKEKPSTAREDTKAARNSSNAVPQARIPVIVTDSKWTKTGAGVEITLHGGKKLYCFDNRKMGEDGQKLFDLLIGAKNKECIFLTATNATKGTDGKPGREFTNITAAIQIGDREWLEDGTPVIQRDPPDSREPGDDSAEDLGWDQTEQLFPGARK